MNDKQQNIIQIYVFLMLWKGISSKKSGESSFLEKKYNTNFSLILPITNSKNIHLHHWIYLIILMKKFKNNNHIKNFCIAGIIQGLLYKDRFEIIKKNTIKSKMFLSNIK